MDDIADVARELAGAAERGEHEAVLLRLDELMTLINEMPKMQVGIGTLEGCAMTAYALHRRLIRLYGIREAFPIATPKL